LNSGLPTISIVIPTINEEANIGPLLDNLEGLGAEEIIVADGGSTDSTAAIAGRRARVVHSPANRGLQMNEGARVAGGGILLFLHADVRLGAGSLDRVRQAMRDGGAPGGCFDIRYEGEDAAARAFTVINRWRRALGVFYGDAGIFSRRRVFEELGGYRPYPVLEDYEFARRLRKTGKLALLDEPIHVSNRRWRNSSIPGTLWSWFWIQGLYLAGVSPERLARMYRNVR